MHSHSFEDAIRKAVSLGADAETLQPLLEAWRKPYGEFLNG